MKYHLVGVWVGLLIGFPLGVLLMWLLEIVGPHEPPGRVPARLVGVSRSRPWRSLARLGHQREQAR